MAAVGYLIMGVWLVNDLAEGVVERLLALVEQRVGISADQAPDRARQLADRFLPFADEARKLAEEV